MAEKKKPGEKGISKTRRSAARPASTQPLKGPASERKNVRSSARKDTQSEKKNVLIPNTDLFRQLIDTVELTMTVFNVDGTILFANKYATHNLSGDAFADVTGKNISEFVSPDQAEDLMRGCRHVIASGTAQHNEVMITMQGVDRWFLNTLHPLSIGDLATPAVLSVSRDITARKETEDSLREAQNLAHLGSWVFDVQEKRLWWSEELYRIFSIRPEEWPITMEDFLNKVHHEDRKGLGEQIALGKPYRSDYRIVLLDGTVKHIHEEVKIQRNTKDEPVRFSGTAQDVTDQKRTEGKLNTELALSTSLLDNIPCIALILRNKTREIVACNAIARQFGAEVGKTCHETLAKTDLPCPFCLAPDLWETGNKSYVEAEYLGKHWDGIWVPFGDDMYVHYIFDVTERKKAEEALRASEERLRRITENAPDIIVELDREGCILYMSRVLKGFDMADVLGRNVCDWTLPEYRSRARQALENVFDTGESQEYESQGAGECGEARWYVSRLSPVITGGEVTRVVLVARDITERKQTEEKIRRSEEKLKAQFRNIPVPTFTWQKFGQQFILVDYNAAAFDLTGGKIVDLVGADLNSLYADTPEIIESISRAYDEKSVIEKEIDYTLRSTGDPGHFSVKFAFVPPDLVMVHAEDITGRKQAEELIRRSEQFIRNILDTVDEGFIVVDRDYRIMNANKAFCTRVGKKSDDVIGRHCYEITRNVERPCFEEGEICAIRLAFESGEPRAALHTYPANGTVMYAEMKAYPLRDASGEITSAIETVTDITEKHLLEEERLKTQKLESIGTLAGGIAHDFNNLLQGIFGYISMARMTIDSREKSLSMLEQAEKALQQTVNLTNQLLTFSKGGQPVMKVIDLGPVIESATAFAMSGSRSDYRITVDQDLWCVMADGGQIAQVIQNIVLNAAQAMPTGGRVIVHARNITADDERFPASLPERDYLAIEVSDSGVGIPARYLDRIFDPYFSTKEKGSGLGLATSYSITRKHEGTIDVASMPGMGSTFTIYIPAVKSEAVEQAVRAVSEVKRDAHILVMDDEEIVREVAGELLKALGFSSEFAEHGDEAVLKYRAALEAGRPFDVVVLDLTVRGGMGGLETISALLEIDPAAKAVVSTGYSDDAAVAQYGKHGFKAFLKKPYNLEELKNTLYALL